MQNLTFKLFNPTSDYKSIKEIPAENGKEEIPENPQFLSVDLYKETIPFKILDAYNNSFKKIASSQSSKMSGRYINLLLDAFKYGDDRYFKLTKLLIEDKESDKKNHQNEKDYRALFLANEDKLIPIKQDQFVVSIMVDIFSDILTFLKDKEFVNLEDYQTKLAKHLAKAEDNYIKSLFFKYIRKDLKHNPEKSDKIYENCLTIIKVFLPSKEELSSGKNLFSLSLKSDKELTLNEIKDRIKNLCLLLETNKKSFQEGIDKVYDKYSQTCPLIVELEDSIKSGKEEKYSDLIEEILKTVGREKCIGIPHSYKDQYGLKDALLEVAGLIPIDYIEEKTGSAIALISLQYNNKNIYRKIFIGNTINFRKIPNLVGLTAFDYEKVLIHSIDDIKEKEDLIINIRKKDEKGEFLRHIEKAVLNYSYEHYIRSLRKDAVLIDAMGFIDFLKKIIFSFYRNELFKKRSEEVQEYIKLIRNALFEYPVEFYDQVKTLYKNSKKGILISSNLHKIIYKNLIEVIQKDEKLLSLLNPNKMYIDKLYESEKNCKTFEAKAKKAEDKFLSIINSDEYKSRDEKMKSLEMQTTNYEKSLDEIKKNNKEEHDKQAKKFEEQEKRFEEQEKKFEEQEKKLNEIYANPDLKEVVELLKNSNLKKIIEILKESSDKKTNDDVSNSNNHRFHM